MLFEQYYDSDENYKVPNYDWSEGLENINSL